MMVFYIQKKYIVQYLNFLSQEQAIIKSSGIKEEVNMLIRHIRSNF